jgi:hypothetical protein
LAKIEETPHSLHIEIGMPSFNGSVAHFDAHKRILSLQITNLFFKSKPADIPFSDITELRLMGSKSAAYPRIVLKSGKAYNLASFSSQDAVQAVQRIQAFLATHSGG